MAAQIARDLPGLSGAELANVLNEGALEAVRRDATSISAADIYNAVDRILQVRTRLTAANAADLLTNKQFSVCAQAGNKYSHPVLSCPVQVFVCCIRIPSTLQSSCLMPHSCSL